MNELQAIEDQDGIRIEIKRHPVIKKGHKYVAYLLNRNGNLYNRKRKAENAYFARYAPDGWQRHGRGYWLIGEIDKGRAWLDENGDRHFEADPR